MHPKKALLPAGVAAALAVPFVTVAASGGKESVRSADARIAVRDNFFEARSLSVKRGDTVLWQWKGDNRHNVSFTSVPRGASKKGSRTKRRGHWSRTFYRRGQYKYVCTLFSGMRGQVTVTARSRSSDGPWSNVTAPAPAAGPPQH
jgi:plastocyanin